MDLSIIILNYNTQELTHECLNAIKDQYQSELDSGAFEIIVVDNASSDESVKQISNLKSKISNLKLIESKENLGFSKGCNLGAKNAKGEYLLFLNSDTEIKDQGFLKMLEFLKNHKDVGILGGKLKNYDGTDQPSVAKFYNLFQLFLFLFRLERRESPREIRKVDWVSGACLMVKKGLFEKIGGFAKELFMYIEDVELCFKAKKAGFATYFYPEVTLYHKELGSSNKTFAILGIYKGIIFFYTKHKPVWQLMFAKLLLRSKALLWYLLGIVLRKEYLAKTYGQALELF